MEVFINSLNGARKYFWKYVKSCRGLKQKQLTHLNTRFNISSIKINTAMWYKWSLQIYSMLSIDSHLQMTSIHQWKLILSEFKSGRMQGNFTSASQE